MKNMPHVRELSRGNANRKYVLFSCLPADKYGISWLRVNDPRTCPRNTLTLAFVLCQ